MSDFFGLEFSGEPFQLFYPPHLVALAIVLLFNLSFIWVRRQDQPFIRKVAVGMAIILLLNESLLHAWNLVNGIWSVQKMVPLHLCSVLIYVSAYTLISGDKRFHPVMYYLGVAGALQALLTPDVGIYGWPHFRFITTHVSHGLLVSSGVFVVAVLGYRPVWRDLWQTLLVLTLYAIPVFIFNLITGSNYLFIVHKPETASLMDILPPWPVYLIYLEGLAFVMMLVLYLPFGLSRTWARNRGSEPAHG